MANLKNGQSAPNFTLQDAEGKQISLQDLLQTGNYVLLVFLRHLG